MIAPTLSVIIPTFNRAGHVRGCLESLRQCGVADLEVIIVDDGSTDDTATVVSATEPLAIYVIQENRGPAAARNHGFRLSRGRFVCFLDCDDEWLPDVAPRMVATLHRHPEIDVLFANAQMGNHLDGFQSWIDVAGQDEFFQLPQREWDDGVRVFERQPLLGRMLVRNCVFLGSTILRREVFERFGPFDPSLCGAADWNLWLRLAAQTTFAFHRESLAIYNKHSNGMSNDVDGMCREFCLALEKLDRQVSLEPEAAAIRDRQLRHHLFNNAYRAFDRGDYRLARRRFRKLLAAVGWEFRGLLYLTACSLPFGMAGLLRSIKHALMGRKNDPEVDDVPPAKAVVAEPR